MGSDATAETSAFWVRLLKTKRKEEMLLEAIRDFRHGVFHPLAFLSNA